MEVKGLSQGGQNFFTTSGQQQNVCTDVQYESSNNSMVDTNLKVSQTDAAIKINGVQDKKIDEKDVKNAVDKLNKLFEGTQTHVEYETVGKSKHLAIKIVDSKTKETIKEIPPKKIIEMIDKLCEMAGIMVDEKA